MPRGRVRVENGTVVSDCGSLLRGGVAKIHAQGKRTGKTAYATDRAYYRQIRKARLNAVRIACLDPWKRSQGHFHWDLTRAADRSEFLSELDHAVELALEQDLYTLIDYHDIGTYDLAQLETFWEIVAPRYASLSHVFYELANEPVSWIPQMYTDQVLREQERVFLRIRELAPQTHVVLLSFANTAKDLVPQGNPMLDVVERMSGVDWTNASVSFHPYRTLSSQIIAPLRERVPVLTTELDLPAHAGSFDEPHIYTSVDGAEYAHQAMERIGVSWFGWGIDGPQRLDKYFRRGVLKDASVKGYLWNPHRPLEKTLADYSSVARFFRDYPVMEAIRLMGLKWRDLAGLGALACGAALIEGMLLGVLVCICTSRGNFPLFGRTILASPFLPHVPATVQTTTGIFVVLAVIVSLIGSIRFGVHRLQLSGARFIDVCSARLKDFAFRRYSEFGKAYFDQHEPVDPVKVIGSNQQFLKLMERLLCAILEVPFLVIYFATAAMWWPALLIVLPLLPCLYWIAQSDSHSGRYIPRGVRQMRTLVAVPPTVVLALVLNASHPPILAIFAPVLMAVLALPHFTALVEVERQFSRNLPILRDFFDMFYDNGKYILPTGPRSFEGLAESIQAWHLTFGYPERMPVLHNVSFTARKGEMTALIGPKGSGKSTLAALLFRYYDVPPYTIVLDSINIREFTPSSLWQNMALVSRDAPLRDDTLRNNLIFGIEEAVSNCDLMRAIQEASLDKVIESLPNGLETRIGMSGVALTGAQRQRLAAARTLLRRPPVVIVDDADALNCYGDSRPYGLLERLTCDCTSLVITGRMSIIKRAHKVVLLNEGRVIEEGAPRELLFRRGRFFQMWAAKQFD